MPPHGCELLRDRQQPSSLAYDQRFPVVVLAASTGGPATVMRLAPGFTRDFPAAIILVQHMPAAFTTQYAAQLAEFTGTRVKEAENNESLDSRNILYLPGRTAFASPIERAHSTGRQQRAHQRIFTEH